MKLITAFFLAAFGTLSCEAGEPDRTIIPLPEPAFAGTIGKTYKDSTAAWPKLPVPPEGAPNVLLIMLDDVGFGQAGTFGGPIPTPALDKLAASGLRYTRFHTTAICGPSRAALITGRTIITSSEPVPAGKSTVRFDFVYDGGELGSGGLGTLFINDKKVGEARIEKTVPGRFGIDTFGVGMDTGSPVSNTYKPPFAFTGTIQEVRIELK